MHKKLKIFSILVGLLPVLVFFWEARDCFPEWPSMCGMMTVLFAIAGVPITYLLFFLNPSYHEGTLWYFTTAVVAGVIYAIVFYWIIRGIQKIVAKIKEKN